MHHLTTDNDSGIIGDEGVEGNDKEGMRDKVLSGIDLL
jgi:hypothetical protein